MKEAALAAERGVVASVPRDALGVQHAVAQGEVRIVSLVPSLTELVFDLGLGDRLVGRTGFCVHPRAALRSVPKVGGTKDVRFDRLRELAPTHVLVNIDENRRDTVDALADFVPSVIVTHPCTARDNIELFQLLGGIFSCQDAAARLQAGLQAALAETAALRAELPAENVLYMIWREPWMTVARDTYISAMLAEVGWHTLPALEGGPSGAERYPVVDAGAPWLNAVQRVLLATEPYHFQAADVAPVQAQYARPALLIDGEMTSWYGSRVIQGLRYLAALRRQLAGAPADAPAGFSR